MDKMTHKIVFIWIGIGVGLFVYLFLLVISIFHVPMSMFLRILPPLVVVGLLLRNTPLWVKCAVGGWLVMMGIYVLFNNDIIGPMTFRICDRPFDMPAQFYYSWRYFWVMAYLLELSWVWGIPSFIFLLGYRIWKNWS